MTHLLEKVKKILIVSSDENLRKVLMFCFDGWGYEVVIRDTPLEGVQEVKKVSPDAIVIDVHSASRAHLAICGLLKEDCITANIPVIALINKRQLREQLLSLKQGVDDYLIKPPDPLDLRVRIEMAMKRAGYNLCATPLTGLPGGRLIEEALRERIASRGQFCFGYIDIDNFKYFNDCYGYHRGDRIIMQTAYILYTTVRKFGNRGDFLGHIGGDDFVFITSNDKADAVCKNFICMFDTLMPFHYSEDDRRRGFILARDRNRRQTRAALVSVSVALVHQRTPQEFTGVVQISEKVSEIKKYLKEIPGSKFMADRRQQTGVQVQEPAVYEKKENIASAYLPLGQVLIEQNCILPEQLDEALKIHWRRDIPLGQTLKDLGVITEEDLAVALKLQQQKFDQLLR